MAKQLFFKNVWIFSKFPADFDNENRVIGFSVGNDWTIFAQGVRQIETLVLFSIQSMTLTHSNLKLSSFAHIE